MGDDGPSRPTPTGGGRGRPTGPTDDWQTASRGRALLQRSKTLQATCDPCRDAAQALAPTADETSQHGTEHGDRKTTTREHGRDWTKMQGTQRRRIALLLSTKSLFGGTSAALPLLVTACWLSPYSLLLKIGGSSAKVSGVDKSDVRNFRLDDRHPARSVGLLCVPCIFVQSPSCSWFSVEIKV